MVRFDMSEFMEPHSVSKLIGAPPGYVGYEEGGLLTERVRRNPYCVILLDEIEKAHPQVFNILLQILDDGRLSDALGHTVDFRNTIIIMTSNLGTRVIQQKPRMGFQAHGDTASDYKVIRDRVLQEVKQHFSPEFINRIDDFIVFYPLDEDDLARVLDLMVERLNQELRERGSGYYLVLTEEARQYLLEVTRKERHFGARPLKRALQTYVEDPLVDFLLSMSGPDVRGPIEVTVDERRQITFRVREMEPASV
jgi:ATP-dependent Clp protease ATP-binding subunit ClpC